MLRQLQFTGHLHHTIIAELDEILQELIFTFKAILT